MKRQKPKEYDYVLKKRFPIFEWLECNDCGEEFRFEKGWELYKRCYENYGVIERGPKVYLCGGCADNELAARRYAEKGPLSVYPESRHMRPPPFKPPRKKPQPPGDE